MLLAPYDSLLDGTLPQLEVQALLEPAGFSDWQTAWQRLQRMAGSQAARDALISLLPHLLAQLPASAGPDGVLVNLDRLAGSTPGRDDLFRFLASHPRSIEILVVIFSSSQFLTEILIKSPGAVKDIERLAHQAEIKTAEQYFREAEEAARAENGHELDGLRRWQHGELLRIGLCDLLDRFDLPTVTGQLSSLADATVRVCMTVLTPALSLETPPPGYVVIAMGKLGGRELNYSSDIDLVFISTTDQPVYTRLSEKLIDALASVTDEGFLYRVDMRLRPWGRAGALVPTAQGYLNYLKGQAKMWEKQALLKARAVAGDIEAGKDFLRQAGSLIYSSNPAEVRAEVFSMKQRTEAHLRQQGRAWGEVKLGEGSIRDIEFVVQYLQMAHGAKQPEIRSRNTLHAIRRLVEYGLLPVEDSRILADGYIFLRTAEHYLQMMHYRQTYTLPSDPAALTHLSRRLGFQGEQAGIHFTARYQQHSAAIRAIFMKYLGDHPMGPDDHSLPPAPGVQQHIERMDPSYSSIFSAQDITRHADLAERLNSDTLVQVDAVALEDGRWRVTIVAYDYPGELSLICGLMFVHGLGIDDGNVFTYEPSQTGVENRAPTQRKIVDVFTVRPSGDPPGPELWGSYAAELADLLRLMRAGQRQDARIQLAKRAAECMGRTAGKAETLYPIDIDLDNQGSQRYTVLRISATDTPGFLYELTTALAFHRIYIAQVQIETVGTHIQDTLYVTDSDGRKILSPEKQREMVTATVLTKHFTHLLPLSPDPQSALLHFHAFIGELFHRPGWPDELASLEKPEVLSALAQLLGVSDFLWDDFLRMQHGNLFPVVSDVDALETAKPREQLEQELEHSLQAAGKQKTPADQPPAWQDALNAFKDREMFRIDMRHILGHTQEFWEFASELTDLAEVVIGAAFRKIYQQLQAVHGQPRQDDGAPAVMAVCGLGKCGGRELGFASDIELMFVYSGNGKTSGPNVITSGEFYEKLVESFMRAIRSRREGIFEIDLQLRPYGKAGSLAVSLEAFRRYFSPGGPAWPYERQALVRMRPIAGDAALGRQLTSLRDAYVYTGAPFDVTAMRAMRERQTRHLVKAGTFNPKYSPGGLVDVEYLVQGLQITHGAANPALRMPNTREGISALAEAGVLSPEDYNRLRRAYTFLRWLIDSIRIVAGNAKELVVPPETSEEFAYLSRRLRYGGDREKLREELLLHSAFVQELNRRLLG